MCCLVLQIAARTLGDLVRKLGEKILPEIIPILEDGLRSDKSDERQGVCIGLSEIMKSTSKDAVRSIGIVLDFNLKRYHDKYWRYPELSDSGDSRTSNYF